MSTTEVLPPPSTSGGARCRQRFHSEGEADSLDSRRKRSFNKKRHDHKRSQHSHSAAKTIRRRAKRHHASKNVLGHHLQPMAPYNTTQFLLSDRDERGHEDEHIAEDDTIGTTVVDHRFRCYSVSSEPQNLSSDSVSGSDEDFDMERDFEADLESAKLDRFDSMNRDEVTRAILQMEKSHCDLADHVVELRCENNRLRKLLNENGIIYEQATEHVSRRRRSSNESSLGSSASTSNSNDEKPE
uniref:HAP1 N-terminal domain-containing protein n=2 Tax=Steinernema glaseri TaxID=37863 RepID=A0A1I8A389_9BILA